MTAQPVVVWVAGQPGSGKTTTAALLHAVLSRRGTVVRIGSDLYKADHPHYPALLAADVRTAGALVRADVRRRQAEEEERARVAGFDVIVETALDDVDEARAASAAYRAAGYRIEVVALAVAEARSQLSVLDRFLDTGRFVAWENHDTTAAALPDVLAAVEAEGLADRVTVVRRGLRPLYTNVLVEGRWERPTAAATAVRAERARPWGARRSRAFGRELVRAEVRVHDERLPVDRRLAVSRDAERAAASAEPVRRIAHPVPGPPGTGYHRLSARQHRWAFDELVAPGLVRAPARLDPVVVYLVGEPGTRMPEVRRVVGRALRPGTVRLDAELLRGTHPDHAALVTDAPRIADELVRPDAEAWQVEAEALVRERRGDVLVLADFTTVEDFAASAGRFVRAGYRVEVVAVADRPADSRQRTLIAHARALELDVPTPLPTPADHARACRTVDAIVAAAAAHPGIATVRVVDGDQHELGRARHALWALAAARLRPYTTAEAARFRTVQRALHRALPRLGAEIDGITAQADPLMPPGLRARPLDTGGVGSVRLPAPAEATRAGRVSPG
ncbi:zeta toxin family protein (plasmid) [Streptomyces sp. BI20]|uniref:zeta toxin family protein n=1 Tax=Streptomyces sp. BI20 TaxID=3403460 RepID=UPI003C7079C2